MLDEKFNDMAIRQFEAAVPHMHEYWVISKSARLTKSPLHKCCTRDQLIARLNQRDVVGVVFHSLPSSNYSILKNIPFNLVAVWLGWGYDYYSIIDQLGNSPLILDKTKRLLGLSARDRVRRNIRFLINNLLGKTIRSTKVLKRIDIFSPVLDLEFDLVSNNLDLQARYVEWNYGTAEDDFSVSDKSFADGNNILVGNSASATNNHIELFDKIAQQVNIGQRKLIVPLSYGDPRYRDKVVEVGKTMFGENFVPLVDFMPIEQYLSIVRSCEFVMMNHLRQQAVGNVCMAMLQGSKVYLNDANPLSDWLARRGAVFGSINNLDMFSLSPIDKLTNSKLVYSHWGRDVQILKTTNLIDAILCKKKERIEV